MIVTLTLVKTVEPVLIYSIDIIVHVQLDIPEEIALKEINWNLWLYSILMHWRFYNADKDTFLNLLVEIVYNYLSFLSILWINVSKYFEGAGGG